MDCPIELRTKFENKWWRLNNLYWILDEDGNRLPFKCNFTQEQLFDALWYFNLVLKARQHGVTTFTDLYFLDECIFNPTVEAGIIAHNKDDAQKIFRRKVKYPYENLPDWLKRQRTLVTDSRSELAFNNGSILYVGTSMRSATVQYLHISEYGKICRKYPDKAEEIKTGSLNAVHAGQMIVIESTAEGAYGDFYDMCQIAQRKLQAGEKMTELDFKFHFFPWFLHPGYQMDPDGVVITTEMRAYFEEIEAKTGVTITDRQRAWYAKKEETQGDKMKQEFPSTPEEAWETAIKGAYFTNQMTLLRKRKQLTVVPYEPKLPVNTGWDLGVDDETVIIFHQRHGQENRIIDYLEDRGYGLGHYAKEIQKKGYVYGTHHLPHDSGVKSMNTETEATTETREMILKRLLPGHRIETVPRIIDIADGIEAVRNFLPTCWIDTEKADKLIKALDAYQREWDDKLGAFKSHPLHNWASNPTDAARTLACGYRYAPASTGKEKFKARRRAGGRAV